MATYRRGPRTAGRPLLYMLIAAAVFAGLLFWGNSWGGLAGWTPLLLILLLCPFIHMFMHRGHGSADGNEQSPDEAVHRH